MINEYRATTLVNKSVLHAKVSRDIGFLFADDDNGAVGMVGTLKVFDRSRRGTALRVSARRYQGNRQGNNKSKTFYVH